MVHWIYGFRTLAGCPQQCGCTGEMLHSCPVQLIPRSLVGRWMHRHGPDLRHRSCLWCFTGVTADGPVGPPESCCAASVAVSLISRSLIGGQQIHMVFDTSRKVWYVIIGHHALVHHHLVPDGAVATSPMLPIFTQRPAVVCGSGCALHSCTQRMQLART